MAEDVYSLLREQLDQYSIGFPATESGVELRILRKLFTAEEAAMYLRLSLLLEWVEQNIDIPTMERIKDTAMHLLLDA